ncbi:hypothetical protein IPZ64_02340 [Streptomyces violaceoruber]|uniref:hypothetical protein n=1 Tax=Streptomyces violaceoruber TaxID=1935 RepID=UPI001F1D16D5|nr:hypothetical protein [Streptomyces violaceoruber]MCF3165774.1 hypothetical protein [Streptomyces violaceoruber]
MTHPARESQARRLAAELRLDRIVLDPAPALGPSPLRTALAAWGSIPADCTHQLLVQDDIAAPASLLGLLPAVVERHPDSVLVFYANWDSRNGAMTRLAALAGAAWASAVPEEYTPTLAVVLPAALAREYVSGVSAEGNGTDDEALAAFLRATGRSARVSVPNLVEHLGDESLVGNGIQGIRRSACCLPEPRAADRLAHGWTLDHVEFLPYMRFQLAHLLVDIVQEGRHRREHLRWQDALAAEDQLTRQLSEHAQAGRRTVEYARTAALFGSGFADELWIHCLLIGWQLGRISDRRVAVGLGGGDTAVRRLIRERALATIGPAALPPERRGALTPDERELLTRFAERGVATWRPSVALA